MSLLQIHDPKNKKQEIVIGIDFGTTNSCVSFVKNSKPLIFKDNEVELVPSILTFEDDWKVGEKSLNSFCISSIKRILGKSYKQIMSLESINPNLKKVIKEIEGKVKIQVGDKFFEITYLASLIFIKLKSIAEKNLDQKVQKAVVSVPAHFDDKQKGAIRHAALLAGLDVIRLIQEPTAAGFAYGIHRDSHDDKGQYLVYDFGGGTFDVSLLNLQGKIIQVIAVNGDDMLGGDDIDLAIAVYLTKKYETNIPITLAKSFKEKIEPGKIAIALKNDHFKNITITHDQSSVAKVSFKDIDKITLSWEEYEECALPFIQKTKDLTSSMISMSSDLKGIILVGGSSKSFLVRKMLSQFGIKILQDINADIAVALGAGLQAENLSRKKSHILIDVVPLSLGIEVIGGLNDKIIFKNTPIPICIKKHFTTHVDNQNAVKFHIIQGEREFAKDCRSLGFFELQGLSPMPSGIPKIEVNFTVDADGLLYIDATESISQVSKDLIVDSNWGISDQEVTNVLKQSFEEAQSDLNLRALQEQILKAEDLISKIHKILQKLSKKHDLNVSIKNLQQAIKSKDLARISEEQVKLEEQFNPICLQHFNMQISSLLTKNKISNFE